MIVKHIRTGQRFLVESTAPALYWVYPDCDKSKPLTWIGKEVVEVVTNWSDL